MNDKELADKVVALGVGEIEDEYGTIGLDAEVFDEHDFVRDWRVAGALMEKIAHMQIDVDQINPECRWCVYCHNVGEQGEVPNSESLSRAIIGACCEALSKRSGPTRANVKAG